MGSPYILASLLIRVLLGQLAYTLCPCVVGQPGLWGHLPSPFPLEHIPRNPWPIGPSLWVPGSGRKILCKPLPSKNISEMDVLGSAASLL